VQFLLIFDCVDFQRSSYGDYNYPLWADGLGWAMSFFALMWIPIYAIYRLYQEPPGDSFKQVTILSSLTDTFTDKNSVDYSANCGD
jgi:hypothetical protein